MQIFWIKHLLWAWSETEPAPTLDEVFIRHMKHGWISDCTKSQMPPLPRGRNFNHSFLLGVKYWIYGSGEVWKTIRHVIQDWPVLSLPIFLGQLMATSKEGKGVRPSFVSPWAHRLLNPLNYTSLRFQPIDFWIFFIFPLMWYLKRKNLLYVKSPKHCSLTTL